MSSGQNSLRTNMKTLTAFLVSILLVITKSDGYVIKVPASSITVPPVTSHIQWAHLQKLLIPLFENVCETSNNPIIRRVAQEFTMDPTDYLEPEVITNLQKLISNGLLPKGAIFTEYDYVHMNELKLIYEVLYNAKDFNVFYTAAAWARQNLNCALYVNALYMAIQNRKDTERLSIPAPYELLPNYFIHKEALIKVSTIFTGENFTPTESIRYEGNAYTIDANYTAPFYDNDDDSKLAYFREDIGLNSYYYLRKLRMAPWFNNDINGSFGENMYQMMKQFMARYNLERYANGLPEVESLNWKSRIDVPYDPMLIYSDGNEFGHRTSSLNILENEDLTLLQTIENNIVNVVSHMLQSEYNKTQIFNHLMEILVTSDKSYETLARQLLGKDRTNKGHASVLEHYMTSLRDPMFWMINKKIVDLVDEALKILPTYARNELYFPGVEVVNIDVKKMTTACDYFEFDVTDALKIGESNSTFKIKVGQPRLNHREFTIRINITSLVSQKGMIKIYLGPKLMPGELAAKKHFFTLLDVLEINLKIGSNIITRSSNNMKHFSEDFMSLSTIHKNLEDAEFGLDSLPLKTVQSQVGYPSRLILPKGTPLGLPLQIFVFVAPYFKANLGNYYSRNSMEFNTAILSPGYPLDLMIEDRQLFGLPNGMIKYITVTQKSDSKVENYGGPGVTKSWYGTETYDPSLRPNYNSNNGQYRENYDYSAKVNEFNVGTNDFNPYNEHLNDYYNVIGLNNVPNLLATSKLDYSAKHKLKEPFDYKAKKAEFDKKDYSAKSDYIKYRTKTNFNANTITATPILEVPSTTEKIVHVNKDKGNVKLNSSVEENEIVIKNMKIPEIEVRDSVEVESLPIPAMLWKDSEEREKVDYKVKKTERNYMIKAKKIELDSLIKDAKRRADIKFHPVKPVNIAEETSGIEASEEKKDHTIVGKDARIFDILSSTTAKTADQVIMDNKVFNTVGQVDLSKDSLTFNKDKSFKFKKPDFKDDMKVDEVSKEYNNKILKDHIIKM